MPRSHEVRSIKAAILASLLVLFIADLFMPLGVAVAVPYVAVVLLTFWLPDRKSIFRIAGLITVLAGVGFLFPYPDGALFGMAFQNRLLALFAIWITAILGKRLLSEQEATRQERDFNESLLETVSSIILLLDTDGRIIYFNHATTEHLGYELREIAGQDWFDTCVSETDQLRARGLFLHGVETGSAWESLFSVVGRDGQEFQFSWSSKPMRDAEGRIEQMLFVGQDVTSLLEAQRRMVATERLAAIGQTITAVSHESRNELMALKLGLDMLAATVADPKAQQLIEHVQNSQTRLHRLLEDVRHYAGPLQLERAICSLQDIWQRAWTSLAAGQQDRDAKLHETLQCQTLDCEVDALRLEQVFRNLFENSLAACADPVWIEIHVSEEHQDGRSLLRISVRDNGPGLSPEAKAKVFEPFFTTKQRGTGLGMAISQRILKAHGGDLCLSETTKHGAEFVLTLPLEIAPHPVESVTK